jgi:penicillin-binding protein 1B
VAKTSRTRSASQTRKPFWRRWKRWQLILAVALLVSSLASLFFLGYSYARFARIVDARLHGEQQRVFPHVYARPMEIRRGQTLTQPQLIDRLNDLGYAQRPQAEQPGEFAVAREVVTIRPRGGGAEGSVVRVVFHVPPRPKAAAKAPAAPETVVGDRIDRLEIAGAGTRESVTLESPLLSTLMTEGREKRRKIPLSLIPPYMVNAVLAIEDKRFYEHPGVDVIRSVKAIFTNLSGDRPYLEGGSTITQQLVKNVFLESVIANPYEKSLRRKVTEQLMALVLERRASKDEILELYLNEVYLGQRGSFGIHGVAEGARLFFGKDVTNVSLAEAATIAGVIQSPPYYSPFAVPKRARERRNVVLQAMADSGFISIETARAAGTEPLTTVARALEAEAPYFVDLVGQTLTEQYPALAFSAQQIDVHTTLDLSLQRVAQDAVRNGLAAVDKQLGRRRAKLPPPQAVLIAADPGTGDVLALVGGRSYNQSQFNRAVRSERQPGSAFKPFVYLAAFEAAAAEGWTDLTPASLVVDEPTTFLYEDKDYTPSNYEDEYDGEITLRRALANSRNVAAVKVAERTGFDRVADLWKRVGVTAPPKPYPSIALGVFEVTPFALTTAYTLFPNLGEIRPLRTITNVLAGGREVPPPKPAPARRVARPETAFLVTNMMRSVIDEGTGASARSLGFTLDAAGKTGTTNDLRDAWFVGFTPELLTVVWVGLDDNQELGLSGAQAALPIWTEFMIKALSGHPDVPFTVPEGVTFVEIDRDNGKLAVPGCPRIFREAFLTGTEPTETCPLHRY